ncbi:hypothetical protein B0H63DRAFT_76801 [Podospora didyma]|uniref:NACHT-NTPase and P-loop NTPases N-terminal domain-containing protein n=1 Tax=Podospora didyma TaxID=330526 RepID=A0AAE0N2H9_9PEZI|nr:hypothetical protein B0H63DRAFT_76801 [Podospora didyma]
MDLVTAVGLVSGILSFVDFSTSLIKGAVKIHESLDGQLDDNRSHEAVLSEMKRFSSQLIPPDDSHLAGIDKDLAFSQMSARALSVKLLDLLGRIKPKDPGSKAQSLWSVLQNKFYEKEKADLEHTSSLSLPARVSAHCCNEPRDKCQIGHPD